MFTVESETFASIAQKTHSYSADVPSSATKQLSGMWRPDPRPNSSGERSLEPRRVFRFTHSTSTLLTIRLSNETAARRLTNPHLNPSREFSPKSLESLSSARSSQHHFHSTDIVSYVTRQLSDGRCLDPRLNSSGEHRREPRRVFRFTHSTSTWLAVQLNSETAARWVTNLRLDLLREFPLESLEFLCSARSSQHHFCSVDIPSSVTRHLSDGRCPDPRLSPSGEPSLEPQGMFHSTRSTSTLLTVLAQQRDGRQMGYRSSSQPFARAPARVAGVCSTSRVVAGTTSAPPMSPA